MKTPREFIAPLSTVANVIGKALSLLILAGTFVAKSLAISGTISSRVLLDLPPDVRG